MDPFLWCTREIVNTWGIPLQALYWKHYIHYIFLSAIEFQEVGITLSTLQKCNILNWLKVVKESKSYPCFSCFRTWPFTYNAILIFLFSLLIWISCSSGEYLVERVFFFFGSELQVSLHTYHLLNLESQYGYIGYIPGKIPLMPLL